MHLTPETVSNFIRSQFPAFYNEEGDNFIQFVEAYFEWLESESGPIHKTRNLLSYKDIDTTLDSFLDNFVSKYMKNVPTNILGNKRLLQKHILDVYRAKGSIEGLKLLFRLLYNEEAQVYIPAADILKPSDGAWIEREYIEISESDYFRNFNTKRIVGTSSGAVAYVDSAEKVFVGSKFSFILFLTNVEGTFQVGERVSYDGLSIIDAPTIIGSPKTFNIDFTSSDHESGDILYANSTLGTGLKVVVANTGTSASGNGTIQFKLDSDGFGYSTRYTLASVSYLGATSGIDANFDIEITNTQDFEIDRTIALAVVANTRIIDYGSNIEFIASNSTIVQASNDAISPATYDRISFNPSANVNANSNLILYSGHPFQEYDIVVYRTNTQDGGHANSDAGEVVIGGLVDGQAYSVRNPNTVSFQLSETAAGAVNNLANTGVGTEHSLTRYGTGNLSGGLLWTSSWGKPDSHYFVNNELVIYEGNSVKTIQFDVASLSGTFELNEYVDGDSTGANGVVRAANSTHIQLSPYSTVNFDTAETITGRRSGATAGVGTISTSTEEIQGLSNGQYYFVTNANDTFLTLTSTVGGANIDIDVTSNSSLHTLTRANEYRFDGSTDVDSGANNFFFVNNHNFSDYEAIQYNANGVGEVIDGLSDGVDYIVINSNTTHFQLSVDAANAATNTVVSVTPASNSAVHYFNRVGWAISADINSLIVEALDIERIEIGEISGLVNINPGRNYNGSVTVSVYDSEVRKFGIEDTINGGIWGNNASVSGRLVFGSGLARELRLIDSGFGYNKDVSGMEFVNRDKVLLTISNTTPTYEPKYTITYGDLVTTEADDFVDGEQIVMIYANGDYSTANGFVVGANGTVMTVNNFVSNSIFGTSNVTMGSNASYINATADTIMVENTYQANDKIVYIANTDNGITGLTTNTVYYVTFANSTDFAVSTTDGGSNVDINYTSPGSNNYAGQLFFNTGEIYGRTSGITATVYNLVKSSVVVSNTFGLYETVTGSVSGATGTVRYVSATNLTLSPYSGLFEENEGLVGSATGVTANCDTINYLTLTADVTRAGVGQAEGFWQDNRGKLDSDKYIQDSYYYQEYSYEVQISKPLYKYGEVLKKVMHTAGNELFGKAVLSTSETESITEEISVTGSFDAADSLLTTTFELGSSRLA